MKNENEFRCKNTQECLKNRKNKECIIQSCGRLFALKLRELINHN